MKNRLVLPLFFALASLLCTYPTQAHTSIINYNPSYRQTIINALLHDQFLMFPGQDMVSEGCITEKELQEQLTARIENGLKNEDIIKKIAIEDGKVIGFAFYIFSKEETIEDACCNPNEALRREILANRPDIVRDGEKARAYVELDVMMIMPEYRNKKFGKKLLKSIIKNAQKRWPTIQVIKLDVLSTNHKACLFYEREGFVVSKRPLSPYSAELNLISYEKALK